MGKHIVFVPGFGGSILVHKHDVSRRFLDKEMVFNRWVCSDMLHPKHNQQWSRDISYSVNKSSEGLILGYKNYNPLIEPYDFGGLNGVQNIAPELNLGSRLYGDLTDTYFNHRYLGQMIQYFQEHRVKKLSAAPYDFRLILDPEIRASYWNKLKTHIESRNVPVVMVAHSQGGLITKWFLHDMWITSQSWVKKHISDIVLINTPFGGCPIALKTVLRGNFYLPLLDRFFMKHLEHNSGVIMGLPNHYGFDRDKVLFRHKHDVVRIRDIEVAHHNTAFQIWKDLYSPSLASIMYPLPVQTHLIVSLGKPTDGVYLNNDIGIVDGDSIVPKSSLLAFKDAHHKIELRNQSHTGALKDPVLFQYIHRLL